MTESFKRVFLFFNYENVEFDTLHEVKKYLLHNALRNESEALKNMRRILDYKILKTLEDYEINIVGENESIDVVLPKMKRGLILKELREDFNLKVPELFISSKALWFGCICFLISISYWIFVTQYLGMFFAIPMMINISISLVLAGLPIVLIEFYQPGFMDENTFAVITNYRMLLDQMILLNKESFMDENNKRLTLEIEVVIDELFKAKNN